MSKPSAWQVRFHHDSPSEWEGAFVTEYEADCHGATWQKEPGGFDKRALHTLDAVAEMLEAEGDRLGSDEAGFHFGFVASWLRARATEGGETRESETKPSEQGGEG